MPPRVPASLTLPTIYLQPKQLLCGQRLKASGLDAATWIGYGGSRGGGKSAAIRRLMIELLFTHPGTTGCIVRRVFGELKKNHIDKFRQEFPQFDSYYRVGDSEYRFPNGSVLAFWYAETLAEVKRKFWGVEFLYIFVDQAEQFAEEELVYIKSANRWPGRTAGECKLGLFFNPGGIGTEFLRRIFYLERYHNKERKEHYSFIQAYGWDNYEWFRTLEGITPRKFYDIPSTCEDKVWGGTWCCRFHMFINLTSEGQVLDAFPPALRAGHLLGSFDSFAGQYFAGVWDESKVILSAKQMEDLVQPWWSRWMAEDWGFSHHAAIGWAVSGMVSPKLFHDVFGVHIDEPLMVAVIYRELIKSEVEEAELTKIACDMTPEWEKKKIRRFFLSPEKAGESGVNKYTGKRAVGETISAVLRQNDLPAVSHAVNRRIPGWRYMYSMMKRTCDVLSGRDNPVQSDDEGPGYSKKMPLFFISGECADMIEAIPMAIRDTVHPGKSEDVLKVNTKADDCLDCVRYLLFSQLGPQSIAPVEVRAAELAATKPDQHEKAMALRKFEYENQKPKRRKSSWRRS